MALMALLLLSSRFFQPHTTLNYEKSRWLLFTAMLLAVVHYLLQIFLGFRAASDELGALVNMIFYTPAVYLVSYASLRMVSDRKHKRLYMLVGFVSVSLILVCFVVGYIYYRSLNMPLALRSMAVVFYISVFYYAFYPLHELFRVKQLVENETGGDIRQFFIYMRVGMAVLFMICITVPFVIFSLKVLSIFGPIILVLLVVYVLSFISFGFNLTPVSDIIDEELDDDNAKPNSEEEVTEEASAPTATLTEQQCKQIRTSIERWRKAQGYSQPDVNSTNLAAKLRVPKRQLILYLSVYEGKTFRVWLSELRIEEAKRMLIEDENYKLETIAYACGFSHRNYLQNRFKAITGFTLREWQENQKKLRSKTQLREKTKNNQYIFAILRRIVAFLAISLWNKCLGVRFLYKLHTKKPLIVHPRVGILYFLLGDCHTFAVQFSTDLG